MFINFSLNRLEALASRFFMQFCHSGNYNSTQ